MEKPKTDSIKKTVGESLRDIKPILGITVKLLAISVITALMLSCVNALTKEKIDGNERAEKAAAIAEIFPEALESVLYEGELDGIAELYVVFENDAPAGYAAQVNPLGFGGAMTVMVGVRADGTLAGVKLISHSETPGLGNRVGETDYLAQYIDKDSAALEGGIDVITGSTISSEAVLAGVESALAVHDVIFSAQEVPNE